MINLCFNRCGMKVSDSFGSPVTVTIALHTQTSSRIMPCCESEDSRPDRKLGTPRPQSGRMRREAEKKQITPHCQSPPLQCTAKSQPLLGLQPPSHKKVLNTAGNKSKISFNPVGPVERVCHAHVTSCSLALLLLRELHRRLGRCQKRPH